MRRQRRRAVGCGVHRRHLESLQADADDRKLIRRDIPVRRLPRRWAGRFSSPRRIAAARAPCAGSVAWRGVLVGRRTPEISRPAPHRAGQSLKVSGPSLAGHLPSAAWSTAFPPCKHAQPVRLAGEKPDAGRRHSLSHHCRFIAATDQATDGVVPLDSALLAGATSTLVVSSGHDVHESPEAVAEVLRILRE